MRRNETEQFADALRPKANYPYDGVIVSIFPDIVHVRLAGAPRKILTNVHIADHIDQEVLRIGMFVKLDGLYDRRDNTTGRTILTDILPQLNFGDYAGSTAVPPPPTISVSADCDNSTWSISWTSVSPAEYYELYWSASSDGTGAELIKETFFRVADVQFDTVVPPKIYFAVRAISGIQEGELSAWVTDLDFLGSAPLIIFGDDFNHGHVTSTGSRWRLSDGKVEVSTSNGANWVDVTPPTVTNTWSDSPAPAPVDIEFNQIIGDDALLVIFGDWQNAGSARRAYMWYSEDLGQTWTQVTMQNAGETEIDFLWAAYLNTEMLVTIWDDGFIELQEWDITTTPSYTGKVSLGASTSGELDAKTYYAFPFMNAGGWYIAGRFQVVP